MKVRTAKTCYCHTCGRAFHYLGITRHRAAHKSRYENCKITFTYGNTEFYEYSNRRRAAEGEK